MKGKLKGELVKVREKYQERKPEKRRCLKVKPD